MASGPVRPRDERSAEYSSMVSSSSPRISFGSFWDAAVMRSNASVPSLASPLRINWPAPRVTRPTSSSMILDRSSALAPMSVSSLSEKLPRSPMLTLMPSMASFTWPRSSP
jgi:hypothetical protein